MVFERQYFSPKEVEAIWGLKTDTLYRWRHDGIGPEFSRAGRSIRYHRDDIEKFLKNGHPLIARAA